MAPNSGTTTAPRGAGAVNSANALTVVRVLLVPAFVVFLFTGGGAVPGWRFAAVAVFLVAALSDRVDGELARRRGIVTDFGKVADPLADKALIGAALAGLSVLGEVAWWVTIVILGREALVTLLRMVVIRRGVIPASHGGKVKTALQVLAVAAYLVPAGAMAQAQAFSVAQAVLMGGALAVTVVTGADYVVRAVRLRRAVSGDTAVGETRG